jgi:hypothetical protein
MHHFKRFVVKFSFISIVFSNVSNISNNSFNKFFMTINKNSNTSWIDYKLCVSNEIIDVSSKSSNDIELFVNDDNNKSIKIWKNIELFISTNWSCFTKNLAIRSIISIERTKNSNLKPEWYHWQWYQWWIFDCRMISLTMISMMNFWFNVECITLLNSYSLWHRY